MIGKAYIVANEEQEREVLGKLEGWGAEWCRSKGKPTDFIPSHVEHTTKLPYALLVENDQISWCDIEALYEFDDIVYDGRNEEQKSNKYVISQKFMDKLEEWKDDIRHEWSDKKDDGKWLNSADIGDLEDIAGDWWLDTEISYKESNNRLITIIRWVNGEDIFEVEKPKKWVVQDKEPGVGRAHHYGKLSWFDGNLELGLFTYDRKEATRFDTKEEAESWSNSHQEVIEV